MTTTTHLPLIDDCAKFLGDLLGAKVTATECSDLDTDSLVVFADYTDDNNATRHFFACDLSTAAILGAALTGVPPSLVTETIAEGTLPDNLEENLREVLNISVNLFPQSDQHRIVLEKMVNGPDAVKDYTACEGTPEMRMKIEVPRYGEGVLIIGAT
jgi:hypothetical protein